MRTVVALCLLLSLGPTQGQGQDAGEGAEESPPAANEQPKTEIREEIDVISSTPLGRDLPSDRAPWSSGRLDREDLEGSASLTTVLERELPGVHLTEVQGSSLQPDLFFRGFSTSPLVGAAQGLSIFHDGVRINEVFGDIVQWDLIQLDSLGELEIVAGGQAGYGVNTLGGAVHLRSDDGFRRAGHQLALDGGSWGQRRLGIQSGGSQGALAYFAAGTLFDEDGWRDFSPSTTRQASTKLSRVGTESRVELAIDFADNQLTGNGAAPVQLLERDRSEIFTYPDETDNRLVFPRLYVERSLGGLDYLRATAFHRRSDIETLNADDFDNEEEGEGEESPDFFNAANNRSRTEQSSFGLTVEMTRVDWLGKGNLFVAGASWEEGNADFASSTELAILTPDRTTVGSGLFDPDGFVDVDTRVRRTALYLVDNATVGKALALNFQVRYNETEIELRDRLGTELNGDHAFERIHPAAGLVWKPRPGRESSLQIFAGLAQSSRTPNPVELTCADPEDPCRLPNAFVADPPLADVVTTTLELGLRSRQGANSWSLVAFGARSDDDIIFISSGRLTNTGHFTNVEETRRLGLEATAGGGTGRLRWHGGYTYVDATFEAPFRVQSPTHPLADGGEIQVLPGDPLPGIPRHLAKAGVSISLKRANVGFDLRASSERTMRGDEAGLLDGVPGFIVADAWLSLPLHRRLTVNLTLDNLLDRDYETFGVLGDPQGVLGEEFDDPRFFSPGAPFAIRLGVEVSLGRADH